MLRPVLFVALYPKLTFPVLLSVSLLVPGVDEFVDQMASPGTRRRSSFWRRCPSSSARERLLAFAIDVDGASPQETNRLARRNATVSVDGAGASQCLNMTISFGGGCDPHGGRRRCDSCLFFFAKIAPP